MLGKAKCSISASDKTFGDPCVGTQKNLAVRISCSEAANTFTFKYKVVVPVGSMGSVVLPASQQADVTVTEGETAVWKASKYIPGVAGVTGVTRSSEGVRIEVGSGSFQFTVVSTTSNVAFI